MKKKVSPVVLKRKYLRRKPQRCERCGWYHLKELLSLTTKRLSKNYYD